MKAGRTSNPSGFTLNGGRVFKKDTVSTQIGEVFQVKKNILFCAAFFLILASVSAASAAKLSDSEYKRMLKACPEFAAAEKHLNAAWKTLKQVSDAQNMKEYQKWQKNWISDTRRESAAGILASKNANLIPAAALKDGKVNKDLAYAVVTEERALWLDELVKQEKDTDYLPTFSGRLSWGRNPAGGYLSFNPDGWWTELLICYAWAELPFVDQAKETLDNSSEGVAPVTVKGRLTSELGFEWYEDTPGVSNFSVKNAGLLMAVDIVGGNANVRNAPNEKGKVLFQVSGGKDFLVVAKKPTKDSSGLEWYEVIYRYADLGPDDESGEGATFVPPDSRPAYIAGKFIEKNPESDEVIESHGLEFFYAHRDDD
jgi:hypothetical protein